MGAGGEKSSTDMYLFCILIFFVGCAFALFDLGYPVKL